MKHISRIVVFRFLLGALVLIGASALYAVSSERGDVSSSRSSGVAGTPIGGPFTLSDQTGKTFTEKDFVGHYVLMYFGFTYCPAICPTELQKMTLALDKVGQAGDGVLPVFVTIDPARDTVGIMAQYVKNFHPRFVGLTGTEEQVAAMLSAYHVYARRVDDPQATDYTMDHSSYIYFIGPDGTLIALFGVGSKSSEIAEKISSVISKH